MGVTTKIDDIFRRNGEKTFLIDGNNQNEISYSQLQTEAVNIANFLLESGLKKGDVLLILLNNSVEFAEIYFACLFSGIVVFPVNPIFSNQEIDYIVKNSKAKTVLSSVDLCKKLNLEDLKSRQCQLICTDIKNTGNLPESCVHLDLKNLDTAHSFVPFHDVEDKDDLILIYTSGTTGTPKGVIHSIDSLFSNGEKFCDLMSLNSDSRFMNILSMSYLGGYYNLLMIPFICEGSVVIGDTFNARIFYMRYCAFDLENQGPI